MKKDLDKVISCVIILIETFARSLTLFKNVEKVLCTGIEPLINFKGFYFTPLALQITR